MAALRVAPRTCPRRAAGGRRALLARRAGHYTGGGNSRRISWGELYGLLRRPSSVVRRPTSGVADAQRVSAANEPRERSGALGPHERACKGSGGRSPPVENRYATM